MLCYEDGTWHTFAGLQGGEELAEAATLCGQHFIGVADPAKVLLSHWPTCLHTR